MSVSPARGAHFQGSGLSKSFEKPVLAWEREARLHGARVAYVTRAARSFNRFTFSTKSPEIPQRTARRSISHAVDRSASSLAALARSLRSLDGGIGH